MTKRKTIFDKALILLALALLPKNNIDQYCDVTLWRLIPIKTITSALKVSTYIITRITMSVSTFKAVVILYVLIFHCRRNDVILNYWYLANKAIITDCTWLQISISQRQDSNVISSSLTLSNVVIKIKRCKLEVKVEYNPLFCRYGLLFYF
jgi:hypothetical protein